MAQYSQLFLLLSDRNTASHWLKIQNYSCYYLTRTLLAVGSMYIPSLASCWLLAIRTPGYLGFLPDWRITCKKLRNPVFNGWVINGYQRELATLRFNGWILADLECPHCQEDPISIFPEIKLRGPNPSVYIHISVSDLYIPTIGLPILLQSILGIYKSLTDTVYECINCEWGRAVSFLGIFFSYFRYCIFAVHLKK